MTINGPGDPFRCTLFLPNIRHPDQNKTGLENEIDVFFFLKCVDECSIFSPKDLLTFGVQEYTINSSVTKEKKLKMKKEKTKHILKLDCI